MSCGGEEDALPAERAMGLKGGRKGYAPRDLAKLFIWGDRNRVRSSRRLDKACRTNLEVIWLLGDLRPDHCSISRFRATHAGRIKGWLKHFNLIAAQAGLFGGEETAVDGTLLRAGNSKACNFTLGKLDQLEAKLRSASPATSTNWPPTMPPTTKRSRPPARCWPAMTTPASAAPFTKATATSRRAGLARCTKGRYRKIQRHEYQDSIDRMRQRMEQDPAAYKRRAVLVEHPFGSMRFWSGARALLCRGLGRARAEFTLSALARWPTTSRAR